MQRDKLGRFIKKAKDGDTITLNGKSYTIKEGGTDAFNAANEGGTYANITKWFEDGKGIEYLQELSLGFDPTGNQNTKKKSGFSLNTAKMSDFLELTRAYAGTFTNNKIAERALEAEKPLLLTPSETHHAIYGDFRAKIAGEQAAAQLRNAASTPLTSDGALQQYAMMQAQLKGLDYINQGNAQDDAVTKQTKELAWSQNKENQTLRQEYADSNKKSMLMSQANKTNIENSRDAANYSQVISPFLEATEQRIRDKENLEKQYQKALVTKQVWNDTNIQLSEKQQFLRNKYLNEGVSAINTYLDANPADEAEYLNLQRIMDSEIIRRQASIDGINVGNVNTPTTGKYGIFGKDGGTIYKAKLTARSKDRDRTARSIETSRKIAARFLEKAINSLYTYNDVELVAKPKNKKRKYQGGGGLPFVGFTPVFATPERREPEANQETKKDSDDDLTTKDILSLLKDMDGLPSDMQMIIASMRSFSLRDQRDPLKLASSSDTASRYMRLISQIKMANFNKNEYDTALNQLKSNGGLNEFAITSEGMLIGTDGEGQYEYFSAKDVADGVHTKKGYSLLTNSNLLYLRANSVDAAFNHKLTTIAQNGIGMQVVNNLIKTTIDKIGTETSSQEGYMSTKQGDIITGLEHFKQAVQASDGEFDGTVDDLYKYKYLTKSQANKAKQAMQYIYLTLPENARTLLKIKSDGSDKGALALLETLISSQESPTSEFSLDLVGGKSHGKSSGSGKDDDELKTSLVLNIQKGIGGQDSYVDIDTGNGIHMSVRGTQYNLIKTPSGEPIEDTSIMTMLTTSGLSSIVSDMRNIQFGDQVLSIEALKNITYNNTGVTRANLPVKEGTTIVDLKLLDAYEKAEQELDMLPNKTAKDVQAVYNKYGLLDLLNEDGSYKQSRFAPFIITEGYTTDALSGLKDSDFLKEYSGDDEQAISTMEKSLAVGSGKNVTKPDIDKKQWYNPGDWFGFFDKIYKGAVYIPININVNAAVEGANQNLDYDEALIQEEKYQNFEKRSNQQTTSAAVLNI